MRIGSLFSGIGGLELGLEWAGVGHTVWQVEQDAFRRSVLAYHWPQAIRHNDVRDVGARNLPGVDVICGGFPCRGVSGAGKKEGLEHPESGLYRELLRIVAELRPRYTVIEQPAAFVRRGLRIVLGELAALGYDAEWSCVSACAVGAPHARERVFVVAHTDADGKPARPVHAEAPRLRADAGRVRHGWAPQPGVVRMADGTPFGLDRLEALGDAVVPQVAEVVGRRLLAIHAERLSEAAA